MMLATIEAHTVGEGARLWEGPFSCLCCFYDHPHGQLAAALHGGARHGVFGNTFHAS